MKLQNSFLPYIFQFDPPPLGVKKYKPELASDTDKAYVTEEKKSKASPRGFCTGGFCIVTTSSGHHTQQFNSNTELSSANTELWPP